jgi:hypothetical protein
MYKNFTLTDEERKEILEQHASHGYKKPLNEQTTINMDIVQGQTIKIKKYLGTTSNLYSDPQNKKFVKQIRFDEMFVQTNGTVSIRVGSDNYFYDCTKPTLIQSNSTMKPGKVDNFYSNNLTPKLQQDFCTTSVGKVSVPRATNASNKTNISNLAQ